MRKAKRRKTFEKNRREAEKAWLPAPESPELADEEDEDEVIPPISRGIEVPEGSKVRGGSEAPEGSQAPGGERVAPNIIVDDEEDGAPQGGSVPPGPREGERAPGGGSETPQEPATPEGLIEPCPAAGVDVEGSPEALRAGTTVGAPVPSLGETGTRPMIPSAPGGSQGALSSQKSAAPRAR